MFNRLSNFVNKYKVFINISIFIIMVSCIIFPVVEIHETYRHYESFLSLPRGNHITFFRKVIVSSQLFEKYYSVLPEKVFTQNIALCNLMISGCLISLVLVLLNIVLAIKGQKNTNIPATLLFLISLILVNNLSFQNTFQVRGNSNWIVILVLLCLMSIYYILWGIDKFRHRPPKAPKPKKLTQKERIEMLEKELAELKSKIN